MSEEEKNKKALDFLITNNKYMDSAEIYQYIDIQDKIIYPTISILQCGEDDKAYYKEYITDIEQLQQENQQLKEQLKQRDEVIDEVIKKTKVVKEYKFDLIGRNEILEILTKYKGDSNGNDKSL